MAMSRASVDLSSAPFTLTLPVMVRPDVGWVWIDFLVRLFLASMMIVTCATDGPRVLGVLAVIAGSLGFHASKAGLAYVLGGGTRFADGLAGAFVDNNGYALATVMIIPLLLATAQNIELIYSGRFLAWVRRIANNVHLQEARTQELIAGYQNQVLTAAREAQTALRGFLESREQVDALNKSVAAAVAATELGTGQYSRGTVNFTPVFQLQTSQVTVQDQLAIAQGNVALNLIDVYRALGGGWEIRTQSAAELAALCVTPESAAAPTMPELTVPRVLTK